jgi:tRNA threonylcarbamoyladenosine biosynthesis protein TsaB
LPLKAIHTQKNFTFLFQTHFPNSIYHTKTVSKGPGSYTGLRIGVSAAKGLAYALEIPLIGLETLSILAAKAIIDEGFIVPMIDARRMEVYSSVFNANRKMVREVRAEIVTAESFIDSEDTIYIVGDCQEKLRPVLERDNIIFLDNIVFPSAREMAGLSHKKYVDGDFEDVAYFEPFYLKDFLITSPKK